MLQRRRSSTATGPGITTEPSVARTARLDRATRLVQLDRFGAGRARAGRRAGAGGRADPRSPPQSWRQRPAHAAGRRALHRAGRGRAQADRGGWRDRARDPGPARAGLVGPGDRPGRRRHDQSRRGAGGRCSATTPAGACSASVPGARIPDARRGCSTGWRRTAPAGPRDPGRGAATAAWCPTARSRSRCSPGSTTVAAAPARRGTCRPGMARRFSTTSETRPAGAGGWSTCFRRRRSTTPAAARVRACGRTA